MNRSIWLLSIAAFLGAAMTRVTDALLPEIASDFRVSISEAAYAIMAFTLAYGVFQLLYGWVGARLGPYRTVAIAAGLSATGAIISALATDLTTLAIGRFWSGMTVAAVIPMSMAYIGETVSYTHRQPVIAKFLMGQVMGVVMGQAFAGFFAQIFDWRALFWALATGSAAISMALFAELRSGRVPSFQAITGPGNPIYAYLRVLQQPWARVILIAVFVEGLFFGTLPYLSAHLAANFEVEPFWIGLSMGCFGVGGIAYISVVARLHKRLGESGLVLWGGTILGFGYILLAIMPFAGPLALAASVIGFGYYMMHNTLQTNATQMAPFDRSSAIALFACALFASQALGVAIAGRISLITGYPAIFAAAGVLNIILGIAVFQALRSRLQS